MFSPQQKRTNRISPVLQVRSSFMSLPSTQQNTQKSQNSSYNFQVRKFDTVFSNCKDIYCQPKEEVKEDEHYSVEYKHIFSNSTIDYGNLDEQMFKVLPHITNDLVRLHISFRNCEQLDDELLLAFLQVIPRNITHFHLCLLGCNNITDSSVVQILSYIPESVTEAHLNLYQCQKLTEETKDQIKADFLDRIENAVVLR